MGGGSETVELRQARYFLAVVEAGTISQAAANLTIVQSAVSQQLARLERELGVALFDRSRRSVQLTRAGADFVPAARALVAAEEAARQAVTGRRTGPVLRIGITGGLDARLYRALQHLRDDEPATVVRTVALPPAERLAALLDGRLDVAVLHGEHERPGLVARTVGRDRLAVVLGAAHPLAARADLVLGDFAPYPLAMQQDAVGTAVTDAVVRGCRAAGFEPRLQTHASAGPFAILSASHDAWSVFYVEQARLLDGDALGLRFVDVAGSDLQVTLSVLATVARSADGARFAAALSGQ